MTYIIASVPYSITANRVVSELDDAQRIVAECIGRANWAQEAPGMPFNGAFTPSERAEADDAITEDGGMVMLADGSLITVVYECSVCGGARVVLDGAWDGRDPQQQPDTIACPACEGS